MNNNNIIKKIVTVVAILCVVCACYFYFQDYIHIFIDTKVQEAKIEDQLDGLNKEENTPALSNNPFFVCDGETFQDEWRSNNGFDLNLIKEILNKSESNYVWYTNFELNIGEEPSYDCEISDISNEQFWSNVEKANIDKVSKISQNAQEYILNFNKSYKVSVDRLERIELPVDDGYPYNQWPDEIWDGMNADEFYEKYKITTKVSQPVLKKIFAGAYASPDDKENFIHGDSVANKCCMVFEVELTNVSSGEHPLDWFPQSGETKKINILVDGALGRHSEFCLVKATIL